VPELEKGLQLEIIVRQNSVEIADRNTGVLRMLPKKAGEYDYEGLSSFLRDVKARYPAVLAASVLLEQDIPYDVLVQTMDNTRVWQNRAGAGIQNVELFPDISVGDAPLVGAAAGAAPAARGAK
jgi:hypothetical protein